MSLMMRIKDSSWLRRKLPLWRKRKLGPNDEEETSLSVRMWTSSTMPKGCASSVIRCKVGRNWPLSVLTMTNLTMLEAFVIVATARGIMSTCEAKSTKQNNKPKPLLLSNEQPENLL